MKTPTSVLKNRKSPEEGAADTDEDQAGTNFNP